MSFTYSKMTHDPNMHGHKVAHAHKRLLELSMAVRAMGEEIKDLSDFLQAYSQGRSMYKKLNNHAAKANTVSTPARRVYGIAKHNLEKKQATQAVVEEEDDLTKYKKKIVAWLMSAPTDSPEIIAECAKAPLSMVRRIRTQLVEAGRLRPLDEPPHPQEEQPQA